eukprot:6179187-Pleurochrysis_carterae.AAC.5
MRLRASLEQQAARHEAGAADAPVEQAHARLRSRLTFRATCSKRHAARTTPCKKWPELSRS